MILSFAAVLAIMTGCAKFDDSSLWNDVDHAYNQLTEIKAQLEELASQTDMLSAVVEGGAITYISENADGGYTVRYKDSGNEEKTVVIAGKENVTTSPLLGTREDNGVLCWTITVDGKTDFLTDIDGAKIPVAGRTPLFTVDSEGCWCVNGNPVLDHEGNKVKAEGKVASVISAVEKDASGNAVLTLADGSKVTVPVFDAFSITLYYSGEEIMNQLQVESSDAPAVVSYEIGGPSADQVIGRKCYSLFGNTVSCSDCVVNQMNVGSPQNVKRRIIPGTNFVCDCSAVPYYEGGKLKLVVQHLRLVSVSDSQ